MIGGNKLISPDLPITKSTEDKLNRGEFAKSLAKTISQYSFPYSFTIGLYGEWKHFNPHHPQGGDTAKRPQA